MSLGGNHEAAQGMKDLLMDKYGYEPEDITSLMEGSNWYAPPTEHNIVSAMEWLVADAQDGDHFVFFFSGHGDQRDAVDDPDETDDKDEYIIPIDHVDRTKVIVDNDIKRLLVHPIQHKKVNLVGIFDCCHSGTIMDLHEHIYNRDDQQEQIDSPIDVESPISPGGYATLQQRVHEPRGRKLYPMPDSVSGGPLALDQSYVVSLADHSRKDEEEKDTKTPSSDKENDKRGVPRSATHPGVQHTITPFTNKFRPYRKSSLPLVPNLGTPVPFQQRGSAHSPAPTSGQAALQNLTNGKDLARGQPPVHYEACVTSWSACADDEQNWENAKGEAMGTPMIQYLYDNPQPTYNELLSALAGIMRNNGKERQRAWRRAGLREKVIIQRPQLGSLGGLNLDDIVSI